MKNIDLQYSYKMKIGFTKVQQNSLLKLKSYGINVNQFIRQAISEKIKNEWPEIKEKNNRIKNAPDWLYDKKVK